eukprot:165776-Ditylum_brightwellii.AAC.1
MRLSMTNAQKQCNWRLKVIQSMSHKEGGEILNGFRKRIRVAIDNLSLTGGDGVIQPNMT